MNKSIIIKNILFAVFLFSFKTDAQVWVYPGASESLKSNKYFVRIFQGDEIYESFVYSSKNNNTQSNGQLTDYNHWTTFSFNNEITVEITKLFGDPIRYCILRPKELRIKPEVNGYVAKIKITRPCKILMEINEAETEPVFIFADPPELNIPDRNNPKVLWFEPGEHSIGKDYSVVDIDEIYMEGGSYVSGSFISNSDKPLRISGRGILSGKNIETDNTNNRLVQLSNIAKNNRIEGITLTDMPGFGIYSISEFTADNVKLLGWSNTSKGILAGDSALIRNCFFKVDDDIITFNHSDIFVEKCVIWQQVNGAPFQFTQNRQREINNCIIKDIDIIRIDLYEDSIWNSDKTIINCKEMNQGTVNNILFEDIRVEGNAHRLIGINTGTGGIFKNLAIRDVNIEGIIEQENYLSAEKGYITGITFDNLVINYMVVNNNNDANIVTRGNISNIVYKE